MSHGSLLVILLLTPLAIAQPAEPPSKAEIAQWLQEQHTLAQMHPVLPGVELSYTIERHRDYAPEAREALYREVGAHPDHPRKLEIELLERYEKNGPDLEEIMLWTPGPANWRFNVTYIRPVLPIEYFDAAQRGAEYWSLSSQRLAVYDEEHRALSGRVFDAWGNHLLKAANAFLYGPLALIPADIVLNEIGLVYENDAWQWSGVRNDGAKYKLVGRWDPEAGRGFVESLRVELENVAESPLEASAESWALDPVLGSWIARKVHQKFVPPVGRQEYMLNAVMSCDEECTESVLATPSIERPDPVRGPLSHKSVDDFKKAAGDRGVSVLTPSSASVEVFWSSRAIQWVSVSACAAFVFLLFMIRRFKASC